VGPTFLDHALNGYRDVRAPSSCCVLVAPRLSCTLEIRCCGPWPGHGYLTRESVSSGAASLRWSRDSDFARLHCGQVLAAKRVRLKSTHPCHGRPCACHLGQKGTSLTDRDGSHKGGHDRRGSDSRLPESEHAMFRINIPQHCRGRLIAHGASGFVLKANRFQGVVVQARIVQACPARLSRN
jgi:hypothetical protein